MDTQTVSPTTQSMEGLEEHEGIAQIVHIGDIVDVGKARPVNDIKEF